MIIGGAVAARLPRHHRRVAGRCGAARTDFADVLRRFQGPGL